MAKYTEINPQELRTLLDYNPLTGELHWKSRDDVGPRWNGRWAGKQAFTALNGKGYHVGAIRGMLCLAHRVIWAWQVGAWPETTIDHRNRNRQDNRWENLRLATASEQQFNTVTQVNNKAGHKGVSWNSNRKLWLAQITARGKHYFLGYHADPEAAALAYRTAAQELHGKFSTHLQGGELGQ